jgi:hypothetical protein
MSTSSFTDRLTIRHWSEDRIRTELAVMCRGRDRFPTQCAFRDVGAQGLLKAVYRFGGVEWWSQQMGVAPPTQPPWLREYRQGLPPVAPAPANRRPRRGPA